MRIDFSSNNIRAALSVVFSPKTYNRIATATARAAFAALTSIRKVISKALHLDKNPDQDKDFAYESTRSSLWGRAVRKSSKICNSVKNFTILINKVIFDILNPKSPHLIGLTKLQEIYDIASIRGDGNCCFYAMTFGLLKVIAQVPSDRRAQLIKDLQEGVNARVQELNDSFCPEVRELAAMTKTLESKEILIATLQETLNENFDLSDNALLTFVNGGQNLAFIGALRYLTSLCGIFNVSKAQDEVDSLCFGLREGHHGIQADSIGEYIEEISRFNPSKESVSYGGGLEILGFSKLFNLSVNVFNVAGIGSADSSLSLDESIARGLIQYQPSQCHNSENSVLLVHNLIHYDVALPKQSPVSDFASRTSSDSSLTSSSSISSDSSGAFTIQEQISKKES